MVLTGLVEASIKQEIAENLSCRHYKNELTHKDIKNLETAFNLKLEEVDASLKSEIKAVHTELNNKIDNIENNLNNQIEKIETSLKSDIVFVSNEIALVRKDMEINKIELNSQLVKIASKLESSLK